MANEILYMELSFEIGGAAMEVHRTLGSGFLEVIYQRALEHELTLRKIAFEAHKKLPVHYKTLRLGEYEADIVVEDKLILELKAVSALNSAHEAQALHYLAATGYRLAILLNFGEASLKSRRIVR